MVAVALLLVVIVDTAITAYMVAQVKHLKSQLSAQARVCRDLSECIADMDEEPKKDAE